jgi:hypothetical protein
LGPVATIALVVVLLTAIDTVIETVLLRLGVYAYPGGIRAITLYAGHTYQLPMSEPFFFAGLGLGAAAALSHFRDDRLRTVVERGLDRGPGGAKRGRRSGSRRSSARSTLPSSCSASSPTSGSRRTLARSHAACAAT